MRVVSQRRLREFWERHGQAESALRGWYRTAEAATWVNFQDVRATCANSVDQVGIWTVFNIGWNASRLIVKIEYEIGFVYVDKVMSHTEYMDWSRKMREGG